MNAVTYKFINKMIHAISMKRQMVVDKLSSGRIKDIEEYRFNIGKIQGYEEAMSMWADVLTELEKELEE